MSRDQDWPLQRHGVFLYDDDDDVTGRKMNGSYRLSPPGRRQRTEICRTIQQPILLLNLSTLVHSGKPHRIRPGYFNSCADNYSHICHFYPRHHIHQIQILVLERKKSHRLPMFPKLFVEQAKVVDNTVR